MPSNVAVNPVIIGELVEWLKSQKQSAKRDYFLNWFGAAYDEYQAQAKFEAVRNGEKVKL